MIQVGSVVKVCDKTGVVLGVCIKVLGHAKKRVAVLGDVIIIAVRRINPKKFQNVKLFRRKKFFKGTLHRALLVRTKINYCRIVGLFIRFNENSVVIVIKRLYLFLIEFMVLFYASFVCVYRL
jgi:large subunit ribosomal protein L14